MKVLALTYTPDGAGKYLKQSWTFAACKRALESFLKELNGSIDGPDYFYDESKEFKFDNESVTYYFQDSFELATPVNNHNSQEPVSLGQKAYETAIMRPTPSEMANTIRSTCKSLIEER